MAKRLESMSRSTWLGRCAGVEPWKEERGLIKTPWHTRVLSTINHRIQQLIYIIIYVLNLLYIYIYVCIYIYILMWQLNAIQRGPDVPICLVSDLQIFTSWDCCWEMQAEFMVDSVDPCKLELKAGVETTVLHTAWLVISGRLDLSWAPF
jgi:hypothetical protein